MLDTKDYYKILELDTRADAADIKKAYKKLAIKYHPDRNPDDPDASEKMALLNEAYAVISNPEKRREYDHLKERFGSGAAGRFRQSNSYEDILRHSDIEQIFQEIADSFGIRGLNELFKVGGGMNSGGFFFFGTFGPQAHQGKHHGHNRVHGHSQGQGKFNAHKKTHLHDNPPKPQLRPYQTFLHEMGSKLLKNALNTLLKVPETDINIYDTITLSPSHARDGGPYAYYHRKKDKKLLVKIPSSIKDGHKIRLKDAGMEDELTGEKGSLFLTVKIKTDLLSKIKQFLLK